MRLVRIKPTYFRAFGNNDWLNLDADLVVLYGPNGFGKTSLAESIEWLIYGKTLRRERGEVLSRRDYDGSYRNVHAPIESVTSVEAEVRLIDGATHNIRRELQIGSRGTESSVTYVDGNKAELPSVGISCDTLYHPVIAQHNLQDFILSRPKERRDKISSALGLESLVSFKTVADQARTRFQASPPETVVLAHADIKQAIRSMLGSTSLKGLGQQWSSGRFDRCRDGQAIIEALVALLGQPVSDRQWAVSELNRRRVDTVQRVFDDGLVRPAADLAERINRINTWALPQFLGSLIVRIGEGFSTMCNWR